MWRNAFLKKESLDEIYYDQCMNNFSNVEYEKDAQRRSGHILSKKVWIKSKVIINSVC